MSYSFKKNHSALFDAIRDGNTKIIEEYIPAHQFSAEEIDEIGAFMMEQDQIGSASMLFEQLLQATPQRAQSHFNIGRVKSENAQLEEALSYIHKALEIEPSHAEAARALLDLQQRIQHRNRAPSIYLITVPKSGSIFLMNSLLRGLDLRLIQTSSRIYMPEDMAVFQHLEQMKMGGWISQEHLPAKKWNLYALERMIHKWVVHVRDPRQALLSWTHHCNSFYQKGMVKYVEMYLPENVEDYFSQNLETQISWQIEYYLPLLIDFISGWLEVSESERYAGRILMTQYEELSQNNELFIQKILDFYAVDENHFRSPDLKQRKGMYHFRQGRSDEWQEVFSVDQSKKSTRMIPERLLQRFNWAV